MALLRVTVNHVGFVLAQPLRIVPAGFGNIDCPWNVTFLEVFGFADIDDDQIILVSFDPRHVRPRADELAGRVIAITGPTRGIGRAVALGCARHGASVILVGRNKSRLESVHAPGDIRSETGFSYDSPAAVPLTPDPSEEDLALLRGAVAAEMAPDYPDFAKRVWGSAVGL